MIPALDLKAVNGQYRDALLAACTQVIDGGWYVNGQALAAFESAFAAYCGTHHCIGVGNGLDALTLTLRAWKIMGQVRDGDEVIVPANTFIASVLAIIEAGLRPVLVEPSAVHYGLPLASARAQQSARTRVIMPVHLYGQMAEVAELVAWARAQGLLVLEDAAQAHGAALDGRRAGSWGDAAGFSFTPARTWARWAMAAPSPPRTTCWPTPCGRCATTARYRSTRMICRASTAVSTSCRPRY